MDFMCSLYKINKFKERLQRPLVWWPKLKTKNKIYKK
jgi:hypothetical protein